MQMTGRKGTLYFVEFQSRIDWVLVVEREKTNSCAATKPTMNRPFVNDYGLAVRLHLRKHAATVDDSKTRSSDADPPLPHARDHARALALAEMKEKPCPNSSASQSSPSPSESIGCARGHESTKSGSRLHRRPPQSALALAATAAIQVRCSSDQQVPANHSNWFAQQPVNQWNASS